MRKIKIAQIGANTYSHSNVILDSLLKQSDLFEVVGVVLPENEQERIVPERMAHDLPLLTLDEVLNDPTIEAVTIETDEIYLTKYAQMAVEAGKHVHMEKPGGADPVAFKKLLDTAREKGNVFHIGYMYRYNPYIRELLDDVKSGKLGEILCVEAQMNAPHGPAVRRWLQQLPGGMMFFLGCHMVDLVLQIQGTPKAIIPYNKCTGQDVMSTTDFGFAVFEYENGTSLVKTNAYEWGGFERRQLVVTGTKGTVQLQPLEHAVGDTEVYTDRVKYLTGDWCEGGEASRSPVFDRYDGMMAAFAAMVRGEQQNPYTLDYEWQLYQTLLKACGEGV